MSLVGLIRQAINGQATWQDVENKVVSLAETGALDALESLENFGAGFLATFAPAEAQSLGNAGVSLLTGASASDAGATLLAQTETNAETAAESALSATASTEASGSTTSTDTASTSSDTSVS